MIYYYLIALFLIVFNEPVMSSWEFAVTTKGKITFYDSNWNETTTAAHQFNDLSAITFDETEETLYFNSHSDNNGSIHSLKLSNDDHNNHHVEKILQKTDGELVEALAFDLLDHELYWTDSRKKVIYQASVDGNIEPKILFKFTNDRIPRGVAVDPCRRKLYYTNTNHTNPSIERSSLDGSNHEILISNKGDDKILFMPIGIAIDQFTKRIFWVDNLEGNHFAVESADLDGNNRRTLVRDVENNPFGITVDRDNVYWTDHTHQTVWKIAKNATIGNKPEIVQNFSTIPFGIISRTNLLSTQEHNPDCAPVVERIKAEIRNGYITEKTTTPKPKEYCFNNGELNPKTNVCICPKEYRGDKCELPICHNYCVRGSCSVSSTGYAQCTCDTGYIGERCEVDLCRGFCLNGGRCDFENGEPVCHCTSSFDGRNCEIMDFESVCRNFCDNEIHDLGNYDLVRICGDCNNSAPTNGGHTKDLIKTKLGDAGYPYTCNDSLNRTIIIATVGVTVSVTLIFLIVKSMRRIYQPLRPKIKKTYVVTKNVTPLTCRPTTEQCEITIEDCCNMNICDTPCFDPKTIQREARKEDKKNLLNNMDGELY